MKHIFTFFSFVLISFLAFSIDVVPTTSVEVSLDSVISASCTNGNNGAIFISVQGAGNTYLVEGAGTADANGIYSPVFPLDRGDAGLNDIYSNGVFFIYFHWGPEAWLIDDNLVAGDWDELYYLDETRSLNLADAVWSNLIPVWGGKAKTSDSKSNLKYSRVSNAFPPSANVTTGVPSGMLGADPIPTGSFSGDVFAISGAGTADVDGVYSAVNIQDKGDGEGYQVYSNGSYFVYFNTNLGVWVIDDNLYADYINELYYFDRNYLFSGYDALAFGGYSPTDLAHVVWTNGVDFDLSAKEAPTGAASLLGDQKLAKTNSAVLSLGTLPEEVSLGASPAPEGYFYELSYNWTGSDDFTSTNQDLTNIPAGEYSLVITSEMSMPTVKADAGIKYLRPIEFDTLAVFGPVSVEKAGAQSIVLGDITDASCPGSLDGLIDISVEGGAQPYSYEWKSAFGNGENFSGYYSPDNWLVDTGAGDGNVSISTISLEIEGNNNGTDSVYTQATIVVIEGGSFSFDWDYSTIDWGPRFDPAFYINNDRIPLTDDGGPSDQSGHVSFEAEAGDAIGFTVYSTDGGVGEGYLTISNFAYPTSEVISTKQDLEAGSGSYLVEVTDGNGCMVISDVYEISDLDTEKPVAVCKDITVYLNEEGKASITSAAINNGTTDNCSFHLPLLDKKHFDCSNLGENLVTMTVTDYSGNYDFCASIVTIADSIKPEIDSMEDISTVVASADECSAVVEFETPTATDICGGVTVEQTAGLASGSEFPVGITVVTFTATDASGNTSESSFAVTVAGINKAPVIDAIADQAVSPYTVTMEVPLSGISAGDDCMAQVVSTITAEAADPSLVTGAVVTHIEEEETAVLTLTLAGQVSGSSEITVTLKDNAGTANGGVDETSTSFILTVLANSAPEANGSIDTVYIDKNSTKTVELPAASGLFSDNDEGDELSISVTAEDGSALPDWISMNEADMKLTLSPTADELGEHKFMLTATDKMGATASVEIIVVVQIPTGFDELTSEFGYRVYPNPTDGFIKVDVKNGDLLEGEIFVRNLVGQEIHRQVYQLSDPIMINLSGQVDGIYFVTLKLGDKEFTKKIIKK
ncbi:HYR domain-containing protein [Sunxiuqinia indica]|uniref:HYR domain-containing protein n=1 Tax=Sunxiuqinia indica TaxID=2692584 RepID=UPI0013587E67|nr:HYR domain-containing protein [Sunxiuqinia indica]